MQWRALAGVLLGFFGIVLLLVNNRDQEFGGDPVSGHPCRRHCVVVRRRAVRQARVARGRGPLTAGTEMMLGGAVLLALSASTGELHPLPHVTLSAGLALTYLIVCGSLIAYYRLRLAPRPDVGHASRQPRLHQPVGRGGVGVFLGR